MRTGTLTVPIANVVQRSSDLDRGGPLARRANTASQPVTRSQLHRRRRRPRCPAGPTPAGGRRGLASRRPRPAPAPRQRRSDRQRRRGQWRCRSERSTALVWDRVDDREPGASRALGIVLMRLPTAEINQHPIAHIIAARLEGLAEPGGICVSARGAHIAWGDGLSARGGERPRRAPISTSATRRDTTRQNEQITALIATVGVAGAYPPARGAAARTFFYGREIQTLKLRLSAAPPCRVCRLLRGDDALAARRSGGRPLARWTRGISGKPSPQICGGYGTQGESRRRALPMKRVLTGPT